MHLIVIPARSGSKGVKNKNIRDVGGIPLIGHTIKAALKISNSRVVVSTDCQKIANLSRDLGADVPFLRPKLLASDTASPTDAVYFTLIELVKLGHLFETVSQLQPTYFYRNPNTLLNCISTLTKHKHADALITVKKIEDTSHPDYVGSVNNEGYLICKSGDTFRRQELKPKYAYFGSVMMAKTEFFSKEKTFYSKNLLPFIIDDQSEALDINTEFDMQIANAVIIQKNKDK